MKTFKCAICEIEYPMPDESVWNDQMAKEEHAQLYPGHDVKNTVITCDECHIAIEMWRRDNEREPNIQ